MRAKLINEALKDVLKPKSQEDIINSAPLFFEIYNITKKNYDLAVFVSTKKDKFLTINSKGNPLFGIEINDVSFQIIGKNNKVILNIYKKDNFGYPNESFDINSFEELENIINEYKIY